MRLLVIVAFLDEESHLPSSLASLAAQRRPPDRLLLVDDGSRDGSAGLVAAFAAAHPYAEVLTRPARPQARDRLAGAPELRAFQWALERARDDAEIVAKLDADVRLPPGLFAAVEERFAGDAELGMTGPYLSAPGRDGRPRRERSPAHHVRGPVRFYRRACLDELLPLEPILGWDTIDEVRARMAGWRTASFAHAEGDPVHLRETGSGQGRLRGARRHGLCAYAAGAHPLHVALGAARRLADPPYVLAGAAYLAGWGLAALRRAPRAEPEVRAFARREQLAAIRRAARPRGPTLAPL